jgi:carbamoyltransferase
VLAAGGVTLDDVDAVAWGWDPARQPDAPEPAGTAERLALLLPADLLPRRRQPPLRPVAHHRAHAAGAWLTSGFDDTAVLVVDGSGERESVSAWHAYGGDLVELWSLPLAASLGFFYTAVTGYLGMALFDEGKTMGLSGWGEPCWDLPSPLDLPAADEAEPTADHYREIMRGWRRVIAQICGLPRAARRPATSAATARTALHADCWQPPYRDLAASAQRRIETDLVALARRVLADTGAAHLAIAGGVGLNCLANGAIETAVRPAALHIQPACHDGGVALGAAAWVSLTEGVKPQLDDSHVYSGPSWTADQVAAQLDGWGLRPAAGDPVDAAVELLATGHVVARFTGGAEYGPRALGARSILADPAHPGIRDRVNRLKQREPWRPLGPALTESAATEVFGGPVSGPFMLIAHDVPAGNRDRLRATVHVDGTTRPQVVRAGVAGDFADLLDRFTARTGGAGLVNTSFNVDGPIVATPRQAVATYLTSDIDALLIEQMLLTKTR